MSTSSSSWKIALQEGAVAGSLASILSTLALAWRSRREAGTPYAGTNAVSHWAWGEEALRRDEADLRHTALGYLTHHGAAIFWAALYSRLYGRHPRAHAVKQAAVGALATSAAAALIDFRFTPDRLTPGFEHRLSRTSLAIVYGGFAAGLFLGALATARSAQRRERPERRARALRWRSPRGASARRGPG